MFRPMLFRHVRTFAAASVGESSFQKVVRVFESTTIELTNAQKLEFYGLFKTATIGTVAGDQPSMMNFVKRAKWDAWSEAANSMDQQQAEDAYKTKACHLMGLTLSEVESKTTLHEADDEAILSGSSSSSSSTSSVPDSSASFRHRELREICGMHSAAAGDVNISLVARAKDYTCVSVQVDAKDGVAVVNLSRPEKMNAMSIPLWEELIDVFDYCSRDPAVRCVVLGGDGEHFCSGMDLGVFATMASLHEEESCQGRKREHLKNLIEYFQNGCSAPELCHVPVLAAIHGNAVGGAIDLLTSCDMRYCVNDAMFCVKEIDLGIVADVGTTQRLPKLVGDQRARELTYTVSFSFFFLHFLLCCQLR